MAKLVIATTLNQSGGYNEWEIEKPDDFLWELRKRGYTEGDIVPQDVLKEIEPLIIGDTMAIEEGIYYGGFSYKIYYKKGGWSKL